MFVQEPIPREYYLKKEDVVEHGVANGCAGCRYYQIGVQQQHTGKCEERSRSLLGDNAMVRLAAEKKDYWVRRREE